MKYFALALALLPGTAYANDFDAAYNSITGDNIAADIATLASDEFEGRGPGGRGEDRTITYLAEQFEAAGAEEAINGSYFQPFGLARLSRTGVSDFTVTGPNGDLNLAMRDDYVLFGGRPEERMTIADSPLVFGGFGIVAPEENWDDYDGVNLTGATIVLFRGDPGTATQDENLFGGIALSPYGLSSTKYDAVSERGGRAVLMIHTDDSAGFPWATIAAGGGGSEQYFLAEDDGPHLDMVAHMSEPAARRMFEAAGMDFDNLYAAAAEAGFHAQPMNLRATGEVSGEIDIITTNNVIARIEGSEAPEECVVYTAHWDHMGINPDAPTEDKIFNGAVDNATGTAMLINMARAYGMLDESPRRSIYFFATAAEERGLYGAEHYVTDPACELVQTAAVLNMDAAFPFSDHWQATTITGLGTSEIEDFVNEAAARLGRVVQDDGAPQAGAFYRSDHWPFVKAGVPALFAVGNPTQAQIEAEPELMERFTNYMTGGYHNPADEYDPDSWLMGGIEGDARIMFETGWMIANDERFPNFNYDTPYRRLRDAMVR